MAPLYQVRERAVVEFGRLAQLHHCAFTDRWLDVFREPEGLLGNEEVSSVADLNAMVHTALNMQIVPLRLAAVLQTLVAAYL